MDNHTTPRVPAGVQAGGQFAPTTHPEPGLSLVPPHTDGPDFDFDFEAARGADLRRELEALPAVTARAAIHASRVADMLRESYAVHWSDGIAPVTRPEAVRSVEDALRHLPRDRREKALELIRFAVHEEMKHREDREFVLNHEHRYELIIDRGDYGSEDSFIDEGQDENREHWELLANTAAFHAISADNSFEALQGAA